MRERDPVEKRADGSHDLYDVATWEPRTALDRLAVKTYRGLRTAARAVVVLVALLITLAIVAQGIGATLVDDPEVLGLVVLSVVPALGLVGYVYLADVTTSEPLELLVGTFVLGVLFAGFAAVINSLLQPVLAVIPGIGIVLFFYLVVGPVEETVKWLAIRLYPFRDSRFDSVVDGAVYGAAAGLGFATIENALFITRNLDMGATSEAVVAAAGTLGLGGILLQTGIDNIIGNIIGAGGEITALRALAGPGHVIYSAFAGYYLGLAKFNRGQAGPIVVKGILVAAFIHATYNTLVGIIPGAAAALTGSPQLVMFFGFVVVYDGVFGYLLYRKLKRYRRVYKRVHDRDARDERDIAPEMTEFDG